MSNVAPNPSVSAQSAVTAPLLPSPSPPDQRTRTWADVVYAALAPCVFGGVRLGSRWLGATPAELDERAGHLPAAAQPLVWLHGASAGEMTAAAHLVNALRANGFAFSAGYTSTNQAGVAVARRAAQPRDSVALGPWDAPHAVARALDGWQPRALFLVETELWPRLVFDASRRNIPVFSVSARIYPRDERRYQLVRPFIAPTVRRLAQILVQNETERARFVRLGADAGRCLVAGDLKQAAAHPPDAAGAARLRTELRVGEHELIVVCGSFHGDELPLLAAALAGVDVPHARFVIAPRHAASVNDIVAALRRRGWRTHRRTDGTPPADWRALVWDTYGELRAAYAIATVAIVGGSFRPHGGHNLLEPIAAGAPVLFGAHTEHCAADARRLLALAPDACVRSADELAVRLRAWLADEGQRRAMLDQQRRALPDGEGIANQYVAVLSPWLREVGLERA